jgi:hypothetical protein
VGVARGGLIKGIKYNISFVWLESLAMQVTGTRAYF